MLHIVDIQSSTPPLTSRNSVIPVIQSALPPFEEYVEEIRSLWDSKWLTNNGTKHQQLELALKEYLQVEQMVLFTNGHMALEAAIEALELTGEVITTPFTFASTTHALIRKGLTPVYGDIRPDNYTLDASKLERLITSKTSAILPVHVYGNVCDVEAIETIAKKHNLKVIYDAAHAFGVTVGGRGIGTFGDVSMFSFHATKVFHTIEGGALTFNNPALKERLERLKNFGITGPESVKEPGGNAKMNEFQAAMGLCNLRHFDEVMAKRKQIREYYDTSLKGIPGIRVLEYQAGVYPNHSYYPIVFTEEINRRDEVAEELAENGILTRKYFYPLVTDYDWMKNQFTSRETPVAQHVANRVLTLPLYPDLAMTDIVRICNTLRERMMTS